MKVVSVLFVILVAQSTAVSGVSIWIEGENATQKDVTQHRWYDAVKKERMSARDWLSHYDQAKRGSATYKFQSPETGDFTFWWRGGSFAANVSYALNGARAKGNRFCGQARRIHDFR